MIVSQLPVVIPLLTTSQFRAYPLTAPDAAPSVICFWKIAKMIVGGMMAKNDALNTLTASVGVSLKENSFTITVTLSVPLSTR